VLLNVCVVTCHVVLHQLQTIHRSVSRSVLQSLVSSLVLSWLDYGNATLVGVSSHLLSRLQSAYFFLIKVPAHHSTPASAALAEGSRVDCIQISTCVFTGLHLHTLSTNFVRWQMSRLVSDFVPVHLHHWLSAAPDCLPSVTELFRSPLLAYGTVCLIVTSTPSVAVFRSRLKTHLFNISHPSALCRCSDT